MKNRLLINLMLLATALAVEPAMGNAGPKPNLFVYELSDGSRIVTDHALNNPDYRLVRTGTDIRGTGHLLASRDSRLFRSDPTTYDRLIREVATRHGIEFALVKAIMHAESSFNPYAASDKGALGLMQVLPATARRHGINEFYDPRQNIEAGVRHLKYLSEFFDNKQYLIIAAYNAGEYAVLRHGGIPPYTETQLYVRKVMTLRRQYSENARS